MCNDATKQEILFHLALSKHSEPTSEQQLSRDIANLAEAIGWPTYLTNLPMTIHKLCKAADARDPKRAKRNSTAWWSRTEHTILHLKYLIDEHSPNSVKEKLDELSKEFA